MDGPTRWRVPGPAAASGVLAGVIGLTCAGLLSYRFIVYPPRPGVWLPALVLLCVGGVYLLARRAGVRPTPLDHALAAVALALAALVAIWADPFLYLVNGMATIVGLGLLAAAFGDKLAPRALAGDPLGHARRAWRDTLPHLGVRALLARRAYRRLAAGLAVAVLTAVGFVGLLMLVGPRSATAALGIVAVTIGLAVARYVYGWLDVSLGRAPARAAADPGGAGDAAAGAARAGSGPWARAQLLVRTAVALALAYACLRGVYLLTIVHTLPRGAEAWRRQFEWCECHTGDPYSSIAGLLATLAVLATLIGIPLAGALADPRRRAVTGWPWIGQLIGTVALVAVLLYLATVGAVLVFGWSGAGPVTAVAIVRLALVVGAAYLACAWRTVTLWLPRWPYAAGAGLIAIGFVVAVNLAHPDARVPGLVLGDTPPADVYPDVDGLSDDAVPWMVAALAAFDPSTTTGGKARVAFLRDLEGRQMRSTVPDEGQMRSGDPDEARRWYEWNLAAWRAERLIRQVNRGGIKPVAIGVGPDGGVYVADALNAQVLRLSPGGGAPGVVGTVGAVAGQAPQLTGLAVAPDGTVYVADQANRRIHRFMPSGEPAEPWAVDAAELAAIAAAPDGSVWVADTAGDRLLQLAPDGRVARTLGGPIDENARPYYQALAAEPGEQGGYQVVACDKSRAEEPAELVRFSRDGRELGRAPIDQAANRLGACYSTWDIAVAPEGDAVLTMDSGSHNVQRFTPDGRPLGTWPIDPAILEHPVAMAVGPASTVHVLDAGTGRVVRFDAAGRPTGVLPGPAAGRWLDPGSAELAVASSGQWQPSDLIVRADGALVVVDVTGEQVLTLTADGARMDGWPARARDRRYMGRFEGRVDVGPGGEVLLLDRWQTEVRRYTPDGKLLGEQGRRGARAGEFDGPAAIAAGGDGGFAVLEPARLQWFDADGAPRRQVGAHDLADGRIGRPEDVAIGPDGTVYAVEADGSRIEAFDPVGRFRTSWGNWAVHVLRARPYTALTVDADGRILAITSGELTGWRPALGAIDPRTNQVAILATFPVDAVAVYEVDVAAALDGTVYVADPINYTVWRTAPGSRALVRWLDGAGAPAVP